MRSDVHLCALPFHTRHSHRIFKDEPTGLATPDTKAAIAHHAAHADQVHAVWE